MLFVVLFLVVAERGGDVKGLPLYLCYLILRLSYTFFFSLIILVAVVIIIVSGNRFDIY
jgi:hypothetical protein